MLCREGQHHTRSPLFSSLALFSTLVGVAHTIDNCTRSIAIPSLFSASFRILFFLFWACSSSYPFNPFSTSLK